MIEKLILELTKSQIKTDNICFQKGQFPSERKIPLLSYHRVDSNIFYPALIAMTLDLLKDHVDSNLKDSLQEIIRSIQNLYSRYQSKDEPKFYNFFETNPNNHFPNGYILSKFRFFKLPEDADVTAILSMTLEGVDKNYVEDLKKKLIPYTNLKRKEVKHTLSKFKKLPVYGTWLGTGAMPVELDFCVMCNILLLSFKHRCDLNEHDIASIEFVSKSIQDLDIINNRFALSYWYPNTSIMLYHAARLYSMMDSSKGLLPANQIVDLLNKQVIKSDCVMEKIILSSSLIRMGADASKIQYTSEELKNSFSNFSFFGYPILYGINIWPFRKLMKNKKLHMQYSNEGYYLCLALEYELLKQFQQKT